MEVGVTFMTATDVALLSLTMLETVVGIDGGVMFGIDCAVQLIKNKTAKITIRRNLEYRRNMMKFSAA
jgi:hypothetical protein